MSFLTCRGLPKEPRATSNSFTKFGPKQRFRVARFGGAVKLLPRVDHFEGDLNSYFKDENHTVFNELQRAGFAELMKLQSEDSNCGFHCFLIPDRSLDLYMIGGT